MKKLAHFLLLMYKRFVSPFLSGNCRYTPTCSMYAYDAIEKYGAVAGSVMGLFRILRCNAFFKGGFEPVPENYRGKIKWLL